MSLLARTNHRSYCPYKGDGTYYSIPVGETKSENAVWTSADVIARIASTVPMERMGEPDEVAEAALYLTSDDSSFVTGIELFVDRGRAQV